jgi:hypothetical protein
MRAPVQETFRVSALSGARPDSRKAFAGRRVLQDATLRTALRRSLHGRLATRAMAEVPLPFCQAAS